MDAPDPELELSLSNSDSQTPFTPPSSPERNPEAEELLKKISFKTLQNMSVASYKGGKQRTFGEIPEEKTSVQQPQKKQVRFEEESQQTRGAWTINPDRLEALQGGVRRLKPADMQTIMEIQKRQQLERDKKIIRLGLLAGAGLAVAAMGILYLSMYGMPSFSKSHAKAQIQEITDEEILKKTAPVAPE